MKAFWYCSTTLPDPLEVLSFSIQFDSKVHSRSLFRTIRELNDEKIYGSLRNGRFYYIMSENGHASYDAITRKFKDSTSRLPESPKFSPETEESVISSKYDFQVYREIIYGAIRNLSRGNAALRPKRATFEGKGEGIFLAYDTISITPTEEQRYFIDKGLALSIEPYFDGRLLLRADMKTRTIRQIFDGNRWISSRVTPRTMHIQVRGRVRALSIVEPRVRYDYVDQKLKMVFGDVEVLKVPVKDDYVLEFERLAFN